MKGYALPHIFAAIMIVATVVLALLGLSYWAAGCGAVALLTLIAAYRSVALQLRTIATGMDLLRSQDFASRLRHVGQREADSMVDLYNGLISSMKAERLRTEEQNDFLIKLVDASPMGIAICDFDGRIEKTNGAFDRLCSGAMEERLRELDFGQAVTMRLSGTQIVRCSRRYFMDHGFRRPFYLVERLTDEIVRAETDVFNKIVRTMGHEVNNTLGGVVSVLETLAELHGDDSDITEVIGSCRTSCTRLGEFVRGYSDVVKLPEPKLERVDLGEMVAGALPFLRKMCGPAISIGAEHCSDSDAPAMAMADPMLLQRVVVNAVKNSIESIGSRPGSIVLRTCGPTLEIIDDGHGLSAEASARIFTPFFSTKHPDRGLGLMLIADILRRHGADFSLTTDPPLTTFRIRLRPAP